MKKVLVALAMVMGLGSSVAFAYVVSGTQSVEQTQQNPQYEFTKVEVKDLPQAVMNLSLIHICPIIRPQVLGSMTLYKARLSMASLIVSSPHTNAPAP